MIIYGTYTELQRGQMGQLKAKEKNKMRSKVLTVALVVALLSTVAWSSQGQPDKTGSVSYEYQVLTDPTETGSMEEGLKKLNELGAQGWELAGVVKVGNNASRLYFKRIRKSR